MKLWMVLALISLSIFAKERVIYGSDDRKDLYEINNQMYLKLARSTAAMIDSTDIKKISSGYLLRKESLESTGICKSERFANQTTAASCSGFLVAPDLMVTAGHCMRYNSDCLYNYWVFDYAVNKQGQGENYIIPEKNVYRCKDIIASANGYENDYALFQLKRVASDRKPLTYRKDGKIRLGTQLVIMGHPTGLPLKIAENAKVKKNSHDDYFSANLDSFSGNSGSAVFNSKTGEVEGILVRGETDYVWTTLNDGTHCKIPNKCSDSIGIFSSCKGEDVTRITNIEELL